MPKAKGEPRKITPTVKLLPRNSIPFTQGKRSVTEGQWTPRTERKVTGRGTQVESKCRKHCLILGTTVEMHTTAMVRSCPRPGKDTPMETEWGPAM